ncbi:unnamed protein product, partial [Discosporangium mesarthrocarpum]
EVTSGRTQQGKQHQERKRRKKRKRHEHDKAALLCGGFSSFNAVGFKSGSKGICDSRATTSLPQAYICSNAPASGFGGQASEEAGNQSKGGGHPGMGKGDRGVGGIIGDLVLLEGVEEEDHMTPAGGGVPPAEEPKGYFPMRTEDCPANAVSKVGSTVLQLNSAGQESDLDAQSSILHPPKGTAYAEDRPRGRRRPGQAKGKRVPRGMTSCSPPDGRD